MTGMGKGGVCAWRMLWYMGTQKLYSDDMTVNTDLVKGLVCEVMRIKVKLAPTNKELELQSKECLSNSESK